MTCPAQHQSLGGGCFAVHNNQSGLEFFDAQAQCEAQGGHLASVTSEEQWTALLGALG